MKINRLFLKIKSLLIFVRSLLVSEANLRISKVLIFWPFFVHMGSLHRNDVHSTQKAEIEGARNK